MTNEKQPDRELEVTLRATTSSSGVVTCTLLQDHDETRAQFLQRAHTALEVFVLKWWNG